MQSEEVIFQFWAGREANTSLRSNYEAENGHDISKLKSRISRMLSLGTTARKCNLVRADERRVALSQLVLKFAWYFDNPPLIPFLFRLYFYVLSFSSIKNSRV
jgi:hypothetical protein